MCPSDRRRTSDPSAEPGHDLIGDHEDAVPPADIRNGGPVALWGNRRGQARADDGLGHERGDGPRSGRDDGALELVGQLLGVAERVGTAQARAIRVRRGNVRNRPSQPS